MQKRSVVRNGISSFLFGSMGVVLSYFSVKTLCLEVNVEIIQSLGSISAIASALVGWSVGWIAQNKQLLIDSSNPSSIDTFDRLSELQKQLIWTWAVTFSCSVVAVVCALLSRVFSIYMFYLSAFFLVVAFYFVVYLFRQMLVLSSLKIDLDSNERHQLRIKRMLTDFNDAEG